jgi:hypothetical protein
LEAIETLYKFAFAFNLIGHSVGPKNASNPTLTVHAIYWHVGAFFELATVRLIRSNRTWSAQFQQKILKK